MLVVGWMLGCACKPGWHAAQGMSSCSSRAAQSHEQTAPPTSTPPAVGVEQAEEEGDLESAGVVGRALHALEDLLRDSYYSTSILVALFLMRECQAEGGLASCKGV